MAGAPEQLGLEGMPARLFSCTPSRLTNWTDCPRRYRFTYLDRPSPQKGPPWAHNSMGAAAHTALKQWWDLPRPRRTPAGAVTLLVACWLTDGFRDERQSAHWRDRAAGWLEGYTAGLDPDRQPIGVERTVSTPTRRLALSGRVDRVDERDGEVVIVDYKTGRWVPDGADARSSLALALYAVAARRTFRRPSYTVELHHLPTGTVAAARHTDESLDRHVRRAEDTAQDITAAVDTLAAGADRDEVFPPASGRHCGWCDFRKHCPEGQAAAPAKDPWAALDPPEASNGS